MRVIRGAATQPETTSVGVGNLGSSALQVDFNHISGETIHFSEATHRLQRWNVPTHVSDPDVPTRYAKYVKDIKYALYAKTHPCESTIVVHKIYKPGRNKAVSTRSAWVGQVNLPRIHPPVPLHRFGSYTAGIQVLEAEKQLC